MASPDMHYYYGLNKSKSSSNKSKSSSDKSVKTSKQVESPKEKEEFIKYKPYPYKHHKLGSRPKYSNFLLDESIATALELVNNHPEVTDKQLKIIETKIKDYSTKKKNLYLEPIVSSGKQKTRKITFSSTTKHGGKKTRNNRKRTRRNKKSKGTKVNSR
jgi:hypothetical protein